MIKRKLSRTQALEALSLLAALLVVVLIGGLAYQTWDAYESHRNEYFVTRTAKENTVALLSAIKDAETSQRGFLLSERERYLEPYNTATQQIPRHLDALKKLGETRPDLRRRVAVMAPVVQIKLDEMAESIRLARAEGGPAATGIILSDRGKVAMDQIREMCQEIEAAVDQRLNQQAIDARGSVQRLGVVSVVGSIGLFALLALAAFNIVRATERREQLIERLEKSEQATRETRDWLETTLASIGDGVIATDTEGRIVFLNAVAQTLTGWTKEDAKGMSLEEVFRITNESTGAIVENPATRAFREGRIIGLANHTQLTSRDGCNYPIDDSAAPIRDKSGKLSGVVLVFRDVTERKVSEVAVEHSIRQFRLMADNAPVLVWIAGADHRWNWLNKVWLDFVGKSLDEELASERTEHVHADDREKMMIAYEAGFRRRRPYSTEYRMRRRDGEYRWVLEQGAPLHDTAGGFMGYIGSCTDITHQKAVEEKLLRANEDLNQFAYAASHDLQEPLRMITSYSELLVSGYHGQVDDETGVSIGFITEGTKRMRSLLSDLLAYTQVGENGYHPSEPVDMNTVLEMSLANLRMGIEDSGATVTSEELPIVMGHTAHFAQLFQNLIGNAIKYRGLRPPVIHVSVRRQGLEWQFAVSDNGLGINPDYHDKIFGVFKRLHGREIPGTGIGLAICQRVVERYDGRIWVNSEVGRGAKFYFTLPADLGGR